MIVGVNPCEVRKTVYRVSRNRCRFYYDPCAVALAVRLAPDPREWAEKWELIKIQATRLAKERAELAERRAKRIAWEKTSKSPSAKRARRALRRRKRNRDAFVEWYNDPRRLRPANTTIVIQPPNDAWHLIKAVNEHPDQFPPDYRWPYGEDTKPKDWPYA